MAIVFLVFGQAVRYGFVNLDDDLYVTENPLVQTGLTLHGLEYVFSHAMCSFYHPITMVSLMVDAQFHGLQAGGYHLTNILIHATTAVLLFLVLRRMTRTLWPGAFVAAVFAIHPLHVESVAWVAERKDVLGGLFLVLTLWAYARHARMIFSWKRYLLVLFLFAAGLLCKPTIVTLPFVMLLLDYWPLGRLQPAAPRSWRPLIVEKLPLFALVVLACVLTLAAEGKTITPPGKLPISLQLENGVVSYATYLFQMAWPAGLTPFYPYPEHGLPAWEIAGAIILVVGISGAVLIWWRRYPYLLVGWLWYLGMLVPMIGLFQVGSFARADRFTYLPQIGICLMVAFGFADLTVSWRNRRPILAGLGLTWIVVLALCSGRQVSFWRDNETLWRHTLACTSENGFAHNNLGAALAAEGRNAEAIEQFQAGLEASPASAATHFNLAAVLALQNRKEEAIQSYEKAIALKPDYAEAENNLGILLAEQGRAGESIRHFENAVADKPSYAEAHNSLGIALATGGQLEAALKSFQRAIEANPEYADAHLNLANVLVLQGHAAEAIRQYQETLRLNPNSEAAKEQLLVLEPQKPVP